MGQVDEVRTVFKNLPSDFWDFIESDTQEYTHGLHTYPATMICPISRNILQIMKKIMPINSLLDPFSGSGTVLVEAMLAGLDNIYGNDINPLAKFMSIVKTTPISIEKLDEEITQLKNKLDNEFSIKKETINSIDCRISSQVDISDKEGWGDSGEIYLDRYIPNEWDLEKLSFKNMGYWIKPKVLIELMIIKKNITNIRNKHIQHFILLAFSEIIRLVSNRRNGEFKMYRMTADKVRDFNPDVLNEFYRILDRNRQKMKDFCEHLPSLYSPIVKIYSDNAMVLSSIPDESVDIMITSPPYGDSKTTVAYGEFSKLSLNLLKKEIESTIDINKIDSNLMGGTKYTKGYNYDLSSETLKVSLEKIKKNDPKRAGDVYSFYKDLDQSIGAISNKSKKLSYQFWVVGNRTVKRELLQTDVIITELATKYNLSHVITLERKISNKVMPLTNSPSNIAGETVTTMNNEHIVVLIKN